MLNDLIFAATKKMNSCHSESINTNPSKLITETIVKKGYQFLRTKIK